MRSGYEMYGQKSAGEMPSWAVYLFRKNGGHAKERQSPHAGHSATALVTASARN